MTCLSEVVINRWHNKELNTLITQENLRNDGSVLNAVFLQFTSMVEWKVYDKYQKLVKPQLLSSFEKDIYDSVIIQKNINASILKY